MVATMFPRCLLSLDVKLQDYVIKYVMNELKLRLDPGYYITDIEEHLKNAADL